jgi:hypothetical protein
MLVGANTQSQTYLCVFHRETATIKLVTYHLSGFDAAVNISISRRFSAACSHSNQRPTLRAIESCAVPPPIQRAHIPTQHHKWQQSTTDPSIQQPLQTNTAVVYTLVQAGPMSSAKWQGAPTIAPLSKYCYMNTVQILTFQPTPATVTHGQADPPHHSTTAQCSTPSQPHPPNPSSPTYSHNQSREVPCVDRDHLRAKTHPVRHNRITTERKVAL